MSEKYSYNINKYILTASSSGIPIAFSSSSWDSPTDARPSCARGVITLNADITKLCSGFAFATSCNYWYSKIFIKWHPPAVS